MPVLRPFPFETPIAPESLIDRRDELERLHLSAADRAHVRLAGPRRFGKTSLLLAHASRLRETGWRTVHVDLYGVTSLAEVCGRIATAYRGLRDQRVSGHLDALGSRLGLTLTPAGPGISLAPSGRRDTADAALAAAAELLDLPVRLHERDGTPTLVVFDEFQDLLSAGSRLDGLLRSHVQYHGDAAVYVYAGSHPSLMRALFADRERPLYGQAEPLELGTLPLDEVVDELHERFAELEEEPGEALGLLVTAAAGHPQRTMLLAHLLHRELQLGAVGDAALAETVLARALGQTAEAHQAVWDGLAAGRKAVLAALADGVAPTGTRAAERHGVARATLQSALRELGAEGQHVVRDERGWRFVDPLLGRWVARRGLAGD
ncbi:hypothetical protein PAI11_06570 [Patulibacter medicamentivorans]|uniref:Orc1-like AAA ATPase domain-containing protein n=1 Tax=Patulibacter medicamentivorans TaxID=1097667 RepID=H0E1J5_9ACTN|nr:hypothetical protein [Patulibacter medicamentivorans]EHN12429.1 hypothetical protein PAI11_06570 [Patulibacter medicamentivorans]